MGFASVPEELGKAGALQKALSEALVASGSDESLFKASCRPSQRI